MGKPDVEVCGIHDAAVVEIRSSVGTRTVVDVGEPDVKVRGVNNRGEVPIPQGGARNNNRVAVCATRSSVQGRTVSGIKERQRGMNRRAASVLPQKRGNPIVVQGPALNPLAILSNVE